MNTHSDFIGELIEKCLKSQTFFPNCLSCNKELRKEFPNYNWSIPLCRECRLKYKEEAERECYHYALQYAQDYPIEIKKNWREQ